MEEEITLRPVLSDSSPSHWDGKRCRTKQAADFPEAPHPGGAAGRMQIRLSWRVQTASCRPASTWHKILSPLGREICCPYDFHMDLNVFALPGKRNVCVSHVSPPWGGTTWLSRCRLVLCQHDRVGSPSDYTSSFFRKPTYVLRKTDTYCVRA